MAATSAAFDAPTNLGLKSDACALIVILWARLVLQKRTAQASRQTPGQAELRYDNTKFRIFTWSGQAGPADSDLVSDWAFAFHSEARLPGERAGFNEVVRTRLAAGELRLTKDYARGLTRGERGLILGQNGYGCKQKGKKTLHEC